MIDRPTFLLLLLHPLLAAVAGAEFMQSPRDVPIARLEENVRRYIEAHPREAQPHYVLGRLYSIAYARERGTFDDVFPPDDPAGSLPGMSELDRFLPDPRPEWRAATRRNLELVAGGRLDDEGLARLAERIVELDSDAYSERQAAQEAILAMGPGALDALRAAAAEEGLSAEQRKRIEVLVASIEASISGVTFLGRAIDSYRAALAKDEGFHLARLGLAWCHEEAGRTDEAIETYRVAHRAAATDELKRKEWSRMSGGWHSSVSYEAGQRLLALLPADAPERTEIAAVCRRLEDLIDQAAQWVTPVVVPLVDVAGVGDLIDDAARVAFDMDGDGVAGRWTWVRPTAGLLVWDPTGGGRVESGRRLFGNATWSVFWNHGYEPLAMLDDDGDGRIAGAEADGLALWVDADGDGVSDPGEVRPLADHGIRSLGCRPRFDGPEPRDPEGVRFADGTVRPTFDWIARRIE